MHQASCPRRTFLGCALSALAAPALAAPGTSTLRIVFPFLAGSGVDATARSLADALRVAADRSAFVDNKPGGNGVIASQEVVRASPDGNTVLYNTGAHTTNGVLMRKLSYDPVASFTPVTMVTRSVGWVLGVGANSPYQTLQQFLDAARKSPGKLTYGSSGIGGSTHVMGALFCKTAGIELTHVPYKGAPITDLIAGVIDASFQSPASLMDMFRSGRLRPLGISSEHRVAALPNVPTFREVGIDANLPAWSGIFAPANLPAPLTEALYEELRKAGQVKSFHDLVGTFGSDVVMMPPAEFRSYLLREMETYRRILPPLGIQMD
jgi:tripartite-type tricarboxylate transporter receptor subunit TctC